MRKDAGCLIKSQVAAHVAVYFQYCLMRLLEIQVFCFGRTLAHDGFLSGVSGIAAQPCFIAVHEFG
jgi:glutaminase